MTRPIARIACAINQTRWPIARVLRTTSPSTRWAGHLSRVDGQLAWPIGQVDWTGGQVSWAGGQKRRTLPPRVYSSP